MNASHQTPAGPRGLRLFLGLFTVAGLFALGTGGLNLVRSLRCESWPTVEGVIESAEMKSQTGGDNGTTYSASLVYSYQVAGIHYAGTRLAFGELSASASRARRILDRFPVGRKVPVYYSPGNPQLAVLEPGLHGGTWVCFGVGTVFVLASVMFRQLFAGGGRALPSRSPGFEAAVTLGRGRSPPPPALMGVIFILLGSFVFFGEPAASVSIWIGLAVGGLFVSVGLFLLTKRLSNPRYSNLLMGVAGLAFLAIFHWVSFGPGGAKAKPFFAGFTILMDLALLAFLVKWLAGRRKD